MLTLRQLGRVAIFRKSPYVQSWSVEVLVSRFRFAWSQCAQMIPWFNFLVKFFLVSPTNIKVRNPKLGTRKNIPSLKLFIPLPQNMLATATDYTIMSAKYSFHHKDYNPSIKTIWKETCSDRHGHLSNFYWQLTLLPSSPRGMQMDKALSGRQRPCFLKPSALAKSILIYFKYIHYCPLKTHYHSMVLRESDRALFAAALGITITVLLH